VGAKTGNAVLIFSSFQMNQFKLNKEIQSFIHGKDKEGESYTPSEINYIQQYQGDGGQGSKGATGEGLLYEFYTPEYIVDLMWKLSRLYGFDPSGTVLEPSLATGRFFAPAPHKKNCYGFEINPTSRRIAQITYPEASIYAGYFETAFLAAPRYTQRLKNEITWLKGYPFSLVIGNPPYGRYTNKYSSYFSKPKMQQIELFFMYYGLKLLKKDGLLVYLTSSNFLRSGISYNNEKIELQKVADLVDAYRLPPVFKASKVPTDILIFRRK
jgi:type I restriction-modification system DNA methylase subunit